MTDWGTDLHHEKNSVENDEGHDEVLEGGGDYPPPQLVLEAVPLFRHVPLQWLRLAGYFEKISLHHCMVIGLNLEIGGEFAAGIITHMKVEAPELKSRYKISDSCQFPHLGAPPLPALGR